MEVFTHFYVEIDSPEAYKKNVFFLGDGFTLGPTVDTRSCVISRRASDDFHEPRVSGCSWFMVRFLLRLWSLGRSASWETALRKLIF